MLKKIILAAACVSLADMASSQEFSSQCQVLFDEVAASHPFDVEQCEQTVASYTLEACEPPTDFSGELPATHLILALDASGSMAGTVGGETKMAIAQREAISFLSDLPDNVHVGLVVYGHEGNNTAAGKAESCGTTELVHGFDASRNDLAATIGGLSPTGWTPLGGVLEYAGTIIADLPETDGDTPTKPVIYLLSDGEETCDGDPVAAAGALFGAGVQTTVNTIGFDVDAETAAQLEQIALAGGGEFQTADSASALRDHLNAIREAEASVVRYEYCVNQNVGRIQSVHHDAAVAMGACFRRNDPSRQRNALFRVVSDLRQSESPDASCIDELNEHALTGYDGLSSWFSVRATALNETSLQLAAQYRQSAGFTAPISSE